MSTVNASPAAPTSSEAQAPVADVAASPPANFEQDSGEDFESNFNRFMEHSFVEQADPVEGQEPTPETPKAPTPETPTPPEAAPANGAPPAPATPAAPASGEALPEVSPEALAAMLMGSQPEAPKAPAAPAAAPTPPAASAAAASPEEASPWTPFPQVLNVPDQLAQGLFESEDPNTRKQALGVLMAAVANAVAQQVEARQKSHWAGEVETRINSASQQRTAREKAQSDFYGEHPDLNNPALLPVVTRAMQVVTQMNPQAQWTPETRKQIGDLARETARRIGLIGAAAPVTAAPAAAAATPKPGVKPPFVAGGARPSGYGDAPNPNSPAGLVDDLTFS